MLWHADPYIHFDSSLAWEPSQDEGTLWVLCVMTARPYVVSASSPALAAAEPVGDGPDVVKTASGQRRHRSAEDAGARRGVGLKLVEGLIAWAQEPGW